MNRNFRNTCSSNRVTAARTKNDQHPPTDIMKGELLIARVYNALQNNDALWQSTLFVLLYDEHGGFYDHVMPPATVAPDDCTDDFSFDSLACACPRSSSPHGSTRASSIRPSIIRVC